MGAGAGRRRAYAGLTAKASASALERTMLERPRTHLVVRPRRKRGLRSGLVRDGRGERLDQAVDREGRRDAIHA